MNLNKGFTLWLSGKPASGKTTLANLCAKELTKRKLLTEVFDSNDLRKNLWPELGYSAGDYSNEAKRIAYFCRLFNRNGINCIAAASIPDNSVRKEIKKQIENIVEASLTASEKTLRARDSQNFYIRAEKGELTGFSGIDGIFSASEEIDIAIFTDAESEKDSLNHIITTLEEINFIEPASDDYSEAEKKQIDERLRALGYL